MAKADLTAQRLRELLNYDPETGALTNAVSRIHCPAGALAGSKRKNGYIEVSLLGGRYYAHRLAWLHVHGEWPQNSVDHINGVRDDNRIANLRDVQHRVNLQNRRSAPSNSMSGVLGAKWIPRKRLWSSRIKVGGATKSLGYYKTADEAHQAFLSAKRRLHEGCTI